MNVPEAIRKCVVFLGIRQVSGEFRLIGTAFLMAREIPNKTAAVLVTARHVIDSARKLGCAQIWIRVNSIESGAKWFETSMNNWFADDDKSIDVAIHNAGAVQWQFEKLDHLVIAHELCATPSTLADNAAGLGDEVFIVGLFRHRDGKARNIPIVRIGNLAALAEERIEVNGFKPMDAYLIEARSIGGLSGSPVFLSLGTMRQSQGSIKISKEPVFFLIGLIHGHYDVPATGTDDGLDESESISTARVNTGIAIVVPIEKILATIDAYLAQY